MFIFDNEWNKIHYNPGDHLDTECYGKPSCSLIMEEPDTRLIGKRKPIWIFHEQSRGHLDKPQYDDKQKAKTVEFSTVIGEFSDIHIHIVAKLITPGN